MGDSYLDRTWQTLSTQYIRSGSVRVELAGQTPDGYVEADGMRIVPVENTVQVQSLQRSLNSEQVTATVSVQANPVIPVTPVTP